MNPYGNPGDGWEGYDRMQAVPARTAAVYRADGLAERVIVPALKGAVTGIVCGLLSGLLIGAFEIKINVWWTMPIVTLSVFLAVFWGSSNRGQWLIERISGADLNGDGVIGMPEQPPALPEKVRVEVIQDEGRRGDFIDLPASAEKLKALANGIVNQNRQFALSLWVGNHGIFSRSEFENLRAVMLERGLARWKNDKSQNQGVELTRQGLAVMRYLASENYHPPTLSGME